MSSKVHRIVRVVTIIAAAPDGCCVLEKPGYFAGRDRRARMLTVGKMKFAKRMYIILCLLAEPVKSEWHRRSDIF
jgi:hypothetical protein